MLLFCIKKTFFNMWDNMLDIFLMNVVMILLVCGLGLLLGTVYPVPFLFFICLFSGFLLLNFYMGAVSRYTRDISDHSKGGIIVFLKYLLSSWKQSIVSSVIMFLLLELAVDIIPFYFNSDSIVSLIIMLLLSQVWIIAFLSGLYYLPVSFRLTDKIRKSIQASLLLLFENRGFTFYMFFGIIIIIVISLLFLFLLFGPATIMLWINVCVKLRLYKYDYLETHPLADKKKIPWPELISRDEELIGERTLRGLIFPWKS